MRVGIDAVGVFRISAFGCPTLEPGKGTQVSLVVTQPDRQAGRNRIVTPTPAAQLAQQAGIRTIKPPDVNHSAIVETIRAAAVDAFVVIAFGQSLDEQCSMEFSRSTCTDRSCRNIAARSD